MSDQPVTLNRHEVPREIRSQLLEFNTSPGISEFKYKKLPLNKKIIRLLSLQPGVLSNPQVDCEIFEAEFNDDLELKRVHAPNHLIRDSCNQASEDSNTIDANKSVEYEALSWRWGDEDNTPYTIMIKENGKLYKKKVSETLGLALKYLRRDSSRILWIDAICINQKDYKERSFQVSMMSLVYTSARQVCVWLGEDDNDSKTAIRFISEEISHLKNFDRLCKDQQHAPKWRALLLLMQRAWFSRRWVIQEITLAQDATVYCGPDRISWRELAIAIELFVEVETATHRLSELMKKDERFSLIPNWFEHISELGASLLVKATARIFREHKGDEGLNSDNSMPQASKVSYRRSLLSLEYLVTSLSIFDCGRPHDSVYALIAIARDAAPRPPSSVVERTKEALVAEVFSDGLEQKPYPLDYDCPYPDICREFTEFCIRRAARSDPIQALDILCRPWAKDWNPEDDEKYRTANPGPGVPDHNARIENNDWETHVLPIRGAGEGRRYTKNSNNWGPLSNPSLSKEGYFNQEDVPIKPEKMKKFAKWGLNLNSNVVTSTSENVTPPNAPSSSYAASSSAQKATQSKEASKEPPKRQHRSRKRGKKAAAAGNHSELHNPRTLGLPSWIARITGAPFDIFPHPGVDMVKMGRKNADPLVGIPQDGHRNYSAAQSTKIEVESLKLRRRARLGHYSLYTKGFRFDRVKKVDQVSQAGAIPATWLELAGWDSALRPGRTTGALTDPPDNFWRTLVADRGMHDRNPPYYYLRACKETILKGGLRSNAVDTTALIYNERNSIIAEFCRRVQAVIWNRALIRTEKGHLGLVSDQVREGDIICIIYGCTVPVILRKGEWKTEGDLRREQFEDGLEAMTRLVRKLEQLKVRRLRYEKKKGEGLKKGDGPVQEDGKEVTWETEIQEKLAEYTESLKERAHNVEITQRDREELNAAAESGGDAVRLRELVAAILSKKKKPAEKANSEQGSIYNPSVFRSASWPDFPFDRVKWELDQSDGESEDSTDEDEDTNEGDWQFGTRNRFGKEQGREQRREQRNKARQTKANKRDPYRYYSFLGEAYIHGMMDGEAVRQKFYKVKPDHYFEIR